MDYSQGVLKIEHPSRLQVAKDVFYWHAKRRASLELKQEFEIDDENIAIIKSFVAYFTGDIDTMQECGMRPNRGIICFGNPGSGKSFLFRVLKDCLHSTSTATVHNNSVPISTLFRKTVFLTCEHMGKLFMAQGESGLNRYGKDCQFDIVFDDLGAEEIRNNYGNKKEVMVDLINERYDNFINLGVITHFTTNLTPSEIEKRYSTRFRSRVRQMCNEMPLGTKATSKDRRK